VEFTLCMLHLVMVAQVLGAKSPRRLRGANLSVGPQRRTCLTLSLCAPTISRCTLNFLENFCNAALWLREHNEHILWIQTASIVFRYGTSLVGHCTIQMQPEVTWSTPWRHMGELNRREWSPSRPDRFNHGKTATPIPTDKQAAWAPQPACTFWREPSGNRTMNLRSTSP
jgi:hypothetical protein